MNLLQYCFLFFKIEGQRLLEETHCIDSNHRSKIQESRHPNPDILNQNLQKFYTHFLLLLQEITTKSMSQNNTHLLSYSSGGQKCEMDFRGLKPRCEQDYVSSGNLEENPFPCLFQFKEAACIPCLSLSPSSKPAIASL